MVWALLFTFPGVRGGGFRAFFKCRLLAPPPAGVGPGVNRITAYTGTNPAREASEASAQAPSRQTGVSKLVECPFLVIIPRLGKCVDKLLPVLPDHFLGRQV